MDIIIVARDFLEGWTLADAVAADDDELLASGDLADGSGLRAFTVAERHGCSAREVINAVRLYLFAVAG